MSLNFPTTPFLHALSLTQRDGMSLLVASLQHWLEMNEECPNILVSTHFHGIVQQKLLPKSPLLEYQV